MGVDQEIIGDRLEQRCDVCVVTYFGQNGVMKNLSDDPSILNQASGKVVVFVQVRVSNNWLIWVHQEVRSWYIFCEKRDVLGIE